MAVIRVDFDELMQFGHTFAVMSDSLEKHARVFDFDASSLDQAVRSFGVQLSIPNDHFRGMNITQASADGQARSRRVADYLNKTGSTLYQHAGAVNAQDDHFDWLGMLDRTTTDGAALVAGIGLTGFAASAIGVATIGSVLGGVVGVMAAPVMLIVLGGSVVIGKIVDLSGDGGFWDQFADALGLTSGVIMLVIGVGAIVAAVALGITAVPYIVAGSVVLGTIAAVAAAGSWAIDNRSVIWQAISNVPSNLKDVGSDVWDFGQTSLDTVLRTSTLDGDLYPPGLGPFPEAGSADAGVLDTVFEAHDAVDEIDFISRFGGTSLTDIGALDRLAGSGVGPLSMLSAGRAAVAVPGTLDGLGGSWEEGDAFGVARDLGELVDQGATMASLVVPASGTVVSLGAKSFVAGLDIGDWIDNRTGFSDFAADSIYDVFFAEASH